MVDLDKAKEKAKQKFNDIIKIYHMYKNDKEFSSNEKQVQRALIEPFVDEILGWNTRDPSQFKVEASTKGKRIDILICHNGVSQFIIEAKSLAVDILDDPNYYRQAITYANNKDRAFAILTNFRYFVILRCDVKVDFPLKAEIGRVDVENLKNGDFDLLYNFNREFWIEKGENNPLYIKLQNLKRRKKVDERLLDDLKEWRQSILNNLKKHPRTNKYDFSNEKQRYEIEEEVQRFIDRLIFICYTEDKEFLDPELKNLLELKKERYNATPSWLLQKIRDLFKKYWNGYNSDLFKTGEADKFFIDDTIIADILVDLRKPKEDLPYDFASIEADILGKTYENFIGHIIAGEKRFKEKESKSKRKSEGIYYTPTYIVDYIVNNTVREYTKRKSYPEILKIKILDPACGSGSFLIKAFDTLVEECQNRLEKELTYEQKKQLMLNCIFGVDKDERAVDICKLNLSLKLAERGQKLPELHDNIKCGDSLIDDENIAGYKAFKWEEEFRDIMDNGGFDVVIGNPPYIDSEEMVKTQPETREYCSLHYKTAKGNWDIYIPFYELAHNLLKEGGVISFITPNKWVSIDYGRELRKKFNNYLIRICNCDEIKVFKDAGNSPVITFIKKGKSTNEIKIDYFNKNQEINNSDSIPSKFLSDSNWGILLSKNPKLLLKLQKINTFIGDSWKVENPFTVSEAYKLINFLFDGKNDKQDGLKLINTGTIDRYISLWGVENTAYIKKRYKYPFIKKSLFRNSMPKRYEQSISSKIIISGIRHFENFLDKKGEYVAGKSTLLIRKISEKLSLEFLSALLNSKLVTYYIKESYSATGIGGGTNFTSKMVAELPAPNKIEKEQEKRIVSLVDKMLSLNKKLQEIGDRNTLEKQKLEQEIKKTDKEIDELVYKLYGVTEEEKKIIEESSRRKF